MRSANRWVRTSRKPSASRIGSTANQRYLITDHFFFLRTILTHDASDGIQLDYNVETVLSHEECQHPNAKSSSFWLLAAAIRRFRENEGHGSIPISTDIPDMTCRSQTFLQIKQM